MCPQSGRTLLSHESCPGLVAPKEVLMTLRSQLLCETHLGQKLGRGDDSDRGDFVRGREDFGPVVSEGIRLKILDGYCDVSP